VECDGLVRDSLRVVPAWVAALVYTVVPFLVLRLYFSRRMEAKLPIAPARVERIRSLVRGAWIAIVIGAAGLASALFGAGIVGVVALLVGVVAYVGIVFVGDVLWVGAVASRRDDVVYLTRVHPEFARALRQHYESADAEAALPAGY
jgi:O-antigen/teichoic acid export membrane protein